MCKLLKLIVLILFLSSSVYAAEEKNNVNLPYGNSLGSESFAEFIYDLPATSIFKVSNIAEEAPDNIYKKLFSKDVLTYPAEKIYKKSYSYISTINPKSGDPKVNSSYPGLRGTNQLVIYTPDFGLKTGTNEFGAEAVVVGNMVKKLSGSNSIIPKDGFVISGHGSAKNWIQKNIVLGSKIYIDTENMCIYSLTTPDTYVFEVNEKINQTANVIKYYKDFDPKYDSRKSYNYLQKAKTYVRKAERNKDKTVSCLVQARQYIDLALQNAVPYKANELKGIWIRPVEHSEKEIIKTVERLKNTGINNVFLETYYHGVSIYPSEVLQKYGVTSQRGEFTGFDPLKIWIDECHRNGIKVHIWFESFYVGNKPPRSSVHHILSVHPEWANSTKDYADLSEIAYSKAEHNGYFIDPANPDVQDFVIEILSEIIEKYKPDGINLDYIRYPLCAKIKSDNYRGTEWGYTQYARQEFKSMYGVDPIRLSVSDPLWSCWYEYRQNKITDFVKKVRKLTCDNNVFFTTVVFPGQKECLETKLQDWSRWSRENLVDGFTPLLLTNDRRTAGNLIREMKQQMSSYTKIYPGLFVMFMDGADDELLMQVHETRKVRSDGLILFDYAHLKEKYASALKVRAFKGD